METKIPSSSSYCWQFEQLSNIIRIEKSYFILLVNESNDSYFLKILFVLDNMDDIKRGGISDDNRANFNRK
uniref:hypothetical protein n=1 Tax=Tetragenococcus halophilus TaxID=51669 RepID=UPI0024E15689|nr:hypothetical protein [Tetragenococcus halophilus]